MRRVMRADPAVFAPPTGAGRRPPRGTPARSSVATITMSAVSAVALVAVLGAWRSSRQGPLPAGLSGPCTVEALVSPADGSTATVLIDPARSAGVYELPAAGTIDYRANLSSGRAPGLRQLLGAVTLDLPPLLGKVTLAHWDQAGALAGAQGTHRYALPARWAPTGLTVRVNATHREEGGVACGGSLTVRMGGSPLGSLLRPVAVGFLVATAWLMARATTGRSRRDDPWAAPEVGPSRWASRGRPAFGVLSGMLFGLAASVVLLLSSAITLSSSWALAVPLLGAIGGALLGWWGPPGGRRGAEADPTPPPEDGERELTILEPL